MTDTKTTKIILIKIYAWVGYVLTVVLASEFLVQGMHKEFPIWLITGFVAFVLFDLSFYLRRFTRYDKN